MTFESIRIEYEVIINYLFITQYSSTASQPTASTITIKLNQQKLNMTASMQGRFIAGLLLLNYISFSLVYLITWQLSLFITLCVFSLLYRV